MESLQMMASLPFRSWDQAVSLLEVEKWQFHQVLQRINCNEINNIYIIVVLHLFATKCPWGGIWNFQNVERTISMLPVWGILQLYIM